MTNVDAPKLSQSQIINAIYDWTDYEEDGVWVPGITFKGGTLPESGNEMQLFIDNSNGHLRQWRTNQWIDLGATSSNLVPYGNNFPTNPNPVENDLFNKLNENLIYQRIGGQWISLGPNDNGLPTGTGAINFTDSSTDAAANLYLIINSYDNSPLLATDQGLVVKKDLSVGGFIGTNQGEVWIGHGRDTIDDVPKILMMHADPNYYYPGYDTLYLRKRIGTSVSDPAHLDLGNLTAHGNFYVDGLLRFNNDAKLSWVNTSTLAIQNSAGTTADGALDVGSIFINNLQPLNSGSPAGININCPLNFNGSRGTSGQILTSNGSGSTPTWQTAPAWNGGTITGTTIYVNNASSVYLHGMSAGIGVAGTYTGISLGSGTKDWLIWNNTDTLSFYLSGTDHGAGEDKMTLNSSGHLSINKLFLGEDVNLYRYSTDLLMTDDSFTVGVNLYVAGTIYENNDIYLGCSIANDAHLHRANVGVISVLDASDNLGTLNVSNIKADHWTAATGSEMYFMNHMRAYSALNILPNANNSGNIGGNGSGTNYYWGAVYANYLMYHTNHTSFDTLNDLDLVKGYKTKTDETGKIVIDNASLPFLRDTEGFFRPDRVNGFLLGCAKATAIKHDEQDNRMNALLTRVEALENQLRAYQTQA